MILACTGPSACLEDAYMRRCARFYEPTRLGGPCFARSLRWASSATRDRPVHGRTDRRSAILLCRSAAPPSRHRPAGRLQPGRCGAAAALRRHRGPPESRATLPAGGCPWRKVQQHHAGQSWRQIWPCEGAAAGAERAGGACRAGAAGCRSGERPTLKI